MSDTKKVSRPRRPSTKRPWLAETLGGGLADAAKSARALNRIFDEMSPKKILMEFMASQAAGFLVAYGGDPETFSSKVSVQYKILQQNKQFKSAIDALKKKGGEEK